MKFTNRHSEARLIKEWHHEMKLNLEGDLGLQLPLKEGGERVKNSRKQKLWVQLPHSWMFSVQKCLWRARCCSVSKLTSLFASEWMLCQSLGVESPTSMRMCHLLLFAMDSKAEPGFSISNTVQYWECRKLPNADSKHWPILVKMAKPDQKQSLRGLTQLQSIHATWRRQGSNQRSSAHQTWAPLASYSSAGLLYPAKQRQLLHCCGRIWVSI